MPDLVPICRSTISTCRDRQRAHIESCSTSASATSHNGPYAARSRLTAINAARRESSVDASKPALASSASIPSQSVGSASRRRSRSCSTGGRVVQPGHVRRVLGPGQELDLPELHRLEAAGRGERRAEGQEVLRGHRLQHVDLLDEHPLDRVRALQPQPGQVVLAGQHPVPGVAELPEQELEPQLVDLVDGDEQQLVVGRRVGDRDLLVEQLGNAQVAAVRQPPALFAEPPVPVLHDGDYACSPDRPTNAGACRSRCPLTLRALALAAIPGAGSARRSAG